MLLIEWQFLRLVHYKSLLYDLLRGLEKWQCSPPRIVQDLLSQRTDLFSHGSGEQ